MFPLKPSLSNAWVLLIAASFASLSACKKNEAIKPPVENQGTTGKEYKTANIAVPASGLIAYWNFDNNGNDLSGNGNHGILHNVSSSIDRFGNPLGAYKLKDATSYITVPDSISLRLNNTDFTLNIWVNSKIMQLAWVQFC
ncbi:hypothetical protein DJ568_12470 [Mucilaginibacter hurinus]|uniref:Uncharacterized protein n=1 Tax=Mucilaginibacter hurinus TaxID=2201324 RepID=A0A367GMD3_9SPHI|nr:hypothetical protein [Mucilaginibacter hurinus]RCH54627.1 hypothetical protein DJ568_12470 [Mucilaginibacter hurinus]